MGNEIKTPNGTNPTPGAPTLPKTFKSDADFRKVRKYARTGKGPQAPAGDSFAKGEPAPTAPGATHAAGPSVPPPLGHGGGVSTRGGFDPKVTAQSERKTNVSPDSEPKTGASPESDPKADGVSNDGLKSQVERTSQYKLVKLGNGEFRLQHKVDSTRSYLIQIFPNADLGAADQTKVGEIIGNLLGLLAHEEGNHGGIKSVTFSGNGGQVTYNQHPDGDKPVNFGGDNDALFVKGTEVRGYLQELDKILKGYSPFQLRLQADNGKKAADDKQDANQPSTDAPPGGASAAAGEPQQESAEAKQKMPEPTPTPKNYEPKDAPVDGE